MGYEAVLHEEGDVPYGKDSTPQDYVHREIALCDILVCVIGGRFGSESLDYLGASITQQEMQTAIDNQVQVFIFIEQAVHSEYSTYLMNKGNAEVKYRFVDDPRVFEFIDSVYNLSKNNPIAPFQTASDIVEFLKSQWAGLFQRFLQDQKRVEEIWVLEEMKSVAGTLEQLVRFFTEERKGEGDAIQQILLANHPVFHQFQQFTETAHRVFFTDVEELNKWLGTRGWNPVAKEQYDEGSYREWVKSESGKYIKLTEQIFDEADNLKVHTSDSWNDDWLQLRDTVPDEEDSSSPT